MDIKDLIKGKRYTIVTDDIFGDQLNIRATFVDSKVYGFDLEDSGGWALYWDDKSIPATFLICKRYRKRKCSVFNIKDIISIEKGW